MDSTVLAAIIAAIISAIVGFIGVWLGYRWSASAALSLAKRSEQRQRKAIKSILEAEVTRNLDSLSKLWAKVVVNTPGLHGAEKVEVLSKNVEGLAMPTWEHDLWKSQFQVLGLGLTADEIQEYWNFHKRLDSFSVGTLSRLGSIVSLTAIWRTRGASATDETGVFQKIDEHLERVGNSVRELQALGEHLKSLH